MDGGNTGKRGAALLLGGLLVLGLAAGCYRMAQGPSSGVGGLWPWASGAATVDPFIQGKKVFSANCARCHSAGGGRDRGPGDEVKGPDLARVGADAGHSRQWLMDYVRDPQAENRLARMPKFERKLTEGDLLALADYLASLKGN